MINRALAGAGLQSLCRQPQQSQLSAELFIPTACTTNQPGRECEVFFLEIQPSIPSFILNCLFRGLLLIYPWRDGPPCIMFLLSIIKKGGLKKYSRRFFFSVNSVAPCVEIYRYFIFAGLVL